MQTSEPPRGAMSIKDFIAWSSLGRTKVYEEINQGRLATVMAGTRRLIAYKEAERWLAALPTSPAGLRP